MERSKLKEEIDTILSYFIEGNEKGNVYYLGLTTEKLLKLFTTFKT